MNQTTRIVGLDCGRGNVHACVINSPIQNLKEYARSYKPLIFQANRADLEQLASVGDVFAIEPTGADHRIFADFLKRQGKTVLLCKGERIRSHARSKGLTNKKDREDAAAIADYCWRGLFNQDEQPNAFISLSGETIRENYHALRSLDRARSPMINQLWARLAYEFPEFLHTDNGTRRRFSPRAWCKPEPPKGLRWIAREIEYPSFDAQLADTIGRGLSQETITLAESLCGLERRKCSTELELERNLAEIEPWYHKAFDQWGLSSLLKAAFLCSCYPFEKFLGEDGKPIHEYVPASSPDAKNDHTFRDRSLKRFMLQMGMGRVIAESGKSKGEWVMGGSKDTRCALYLFVKSCVQFTVSRSKPVRGRSEPEADYKKRIKDWQPFKEWLPDIADDLRVKKIDPWNNDAIVNAVVERNKVLPKIAKLQIYYQISPTCQNLRDEQRIMKVSSRFCRDLYRELLKEYKAR